MLSGPCRKTGFTLVELSIVLVVIGLVVGGVLVAQSMIRTVKVQSFIRQIGQFDTAVVNFKTRYNGLPGDSSAFGCVNVSNKCDNGVIEDSTGNASTYVRYFDSEVASFWPNLQQSGLIVPGVTLTASMTGVFNVAPPNANSPAMAIGEKTGIIPFLQVDPMFDIQSNYYAIADWSSNASTDLWHPAYPLATTSVLEAAAVDLKIDDGIPTTGTVFGFGGGGWTQNGTCVASGKYNVSDSTDKCMLIIKMLSRIGMRQ